MTVTAATLKSALQGLPDDAQEAVVSACFSYPFLQALGFERDEIHPGYETGSGKVDKAARKTIGDDVFLQTQSNPYLLVEVKRRNTNLATDTAPYQKAVAQLKRYLLAEKCQTAKWGILTNSCHVQLFRKHGKVVYPVTACLPINAENIDEIAAEIRKKIEKPTKALTVAIYNNKGGVGKTTTTVNLAAVLTLAKKRVLAIDFDPNQQDLTSALGLQPSDGRVFEALINRDIDIQTTLQSYKFLRRTTGTELQFDVIPADSRLIDGSDKVLNQQLTYTGLYRKLESARQNYDYILLDVPPNWRFFSQLAVYAADVILIPTKHNNLFSLKNAATVIKQFLPEVQKRKSDGTPIALPIFFNGEKISEPQREAAKKAIDRIIGEAHQERFDLKPYFDPKSANSSNSKDIFEIPSYANIASSAFSCIPAVYRDRSARMYYKELAKEYFLQ